MLNYNVHSRRIPQRWHENTLSSGATVCPDPREIKTTPQTPMLNRQEDHGQLCWMLMSSPTCHHLVAYRGPLSGQLPVLSLFSDQGRHWMGPRLICPPGKKGIPSMWPSETAEGRASNRSIISYLYYRTAKHGRPLVCYKNLYLSTAFSKRRIPVKSACNLMKFSLRCWPFPTWSIL